MEYGFKLNKKNADVQYKIELQDCNISGNTVQYRLKDNSIIAYQLDENGYAIASTKQSFENVELTRTQLSVFQVLADFADKNENGFDKKDLKKLDEFELGQKIVSTLATENSSYNLTHIEITKNSVQLSLDDYNGNEKKLKIEFPTKKFSDYFKGLFKSNKKEKPLETKNQTQTASIEVGNLEEQPIDPTNLEDNSKVTEPNLSKRELRRAQRKARKESKKFGLEPQEKKFDFKGEIEPEYYYNLAQIACRCCCTICKVSFNGRNNITSAIHQRISLLCNGKACHLERRLAENLLQSAKFRFIFTIQDHRLHNTGYNGLFHRIVCLQGCQNTQIVVRTIHFFDNLIVIAFSCNETGLNLTSVQQIL